MTTFKTGTSPLVVVLPRVTCQQLHHVTVPHSPTRENVQREQSCVQWRPDDVILMVNRPKEFVLFHR